MIIDLILDRRDGKSFDPCEFAFQVNDYAAIWPGLARPILDALSSRNEDCVRRALCIYINLAGYDTEICDYVNSVCWLPAWWEMD